MMSESEVKEGQGVKEDDLTRHVSPGDILAAARAVYGRRATVTSMRAEKATASVSGFLSLLLRVHVTIQLSESSAAFNTTFILKRLPTSPSHRDMVQSCGMFDQEIAFFTRAVPILKQKIPNLPLVEVYVAHDNVLVMEDLSTKKYQCLTNSIKDLGTEILKFPHMILIVRKLAKLHASSLGVNWLKIIPLFQNDAMFENKSKNEEFKKMIDTSLRMFAVSIKELYPQNYEKYQSFILHPKFVEMIVKLSKKGSDLNVLNHGDCWVNNIMFKLDPKTKEPVDLKFIDLQLCRYAPPSRDLLYLLYAFTTKSFRETYEWEILRAYVEAFNTYACVTPDLLSLEEFRQEYESARLFGVFIALLVRPTSYLDNVVPGENEELKDEFFDTLMYGESEESMVKNLRKNLGYRNALIEIINETMEIIDKL